MTTRTASRPQLGISFFGLALIGIISGGWGVLLPPLSTYYQVDKSVVGLLFFASASGYFLSALSSGFLIAKLGTRWYLVAGTLTFIFACLCTALKLPFALIFVIRLIQGIASATIEAGMNIFIARLPNNIRLLNYLHAFYGAGALVGPLAASAVLAASLGWNLAFVLWALLALPLLIGLLVFFPRGKQSETQEEQAGKRESNLLVALKLPMVWITTLYLFFYVGVEVSLGSWGYTFLLENRHESAWLAGGIVSGYWLGLTLGRFVLDNIAQRLNMTLSALMYTCMGGILLGIAIIWFIPGSISSAIAFCLIGTSLGPIYPCTVSLLPSLVPDRVAESAMGFLIGLSVLGVAFFPWIAGTLAKFTSIWSLLPYNVGLTAIMLAFWWTIQRRKQGAQIQGETFAAASAPSLENL